jgi:hypothetical protein
MSSRQVEGGPAPRREGDGPARPQQTAPARAADFSSVVAAADRDDGNVEAEGLGPLWTSLTPGVQYAIAHTLAQQGPLSRGVTTLALRHSETVGLLHLIEDERAKAAGMERLVGEHEEPGTVPLSGRASDLMPVTASIGRAEIEQGQRFLRARGLEAEAESLAGWLGGGGSYHPIEIDNALGGFLADLHRFPEEEEDGPDVRIRRQTARTMQRMDEQEVLVRLDPPPQTVNPRRLSSGAGPRTPSEGVGVGGLQVLSGGLHPTNYIVTGRSGQRYSILDNSPWAD